MNPSTRDRLRKAWGLCDRHAWGWMAVEAAFRSGYMHGPAVLYDDLMGRALACFEMHGAGHLGRLSRRLRRKGPCLMCEEGYDCGSTGFIKEDRVARGRDLNELLGLARRTRPYWRHAVCGTCAGTSSPQRCRRHLIEEKSRGVTDNMSVHRSLVTYMSDHLANYARSFQFEFRGTETEEDAAALISAVGWCSGWAIFLSVTGEMPLGDGNAASANRIQPYEERMPE